MNDNPKKTLLLTPGPLTTSVSVKEAMLKDWGSRDSNFSNMTIRVRRAVEKIAGVQGDVNTHTCIPLQGSGTFAIEAAITSLVPRDGKVLVLVNGAYGRRICKICDYNDRNYSVYETGENIRPSPQDLLSILTSDKQITDVVVVHCETTSGILNPVEELAEVVAGAKCRLVIDAMSTFGAIKLDVKDTNCSAIIASSGKCLEGVPGIGLIIAEKENLKISRNRSSSLSLDLYDQWINLESSSQWRFTPPTHAVAALDQALLEHEAEGGVNGRCMRYNTNHNFLVKNMRELGFRTYLPYELQSPIIVTFHAPNHERYTFDMFYQLLNAKGIIIYPGKLTDIDTFRIGCIGQLNEQDMLVVVNSVQEVIDEMGIKL